MSVADRLAERATGTVVAGDFEWQIRRPSSMDLLAAGARHLAARLPAPPDPMPEGTVEPEASDEDRIAMVSLVVRESMTMACASVTAARPVGAAEWEPLRLVLTEGETGPGRVWVESLTMDEAIVIAKAVGALSNKERDRAAATFRGGSEPGAAGGRDGEAVRETPA